VKILRTLFCALAFVSAFIAVPSASAQVQTLGQWQTIPNTMPINPVHIALMHTGKVLVVSGSGNVPTNTNWQAGVFTPGTGAITLQPLGWDMFCNGMVILPDGRPLVVGGTLQYDPFHGETRISAFDPVTGAFTDLQSMAHGRWYPSVTTLGDGRVMTFSGLLETGGTNTTVEIYTVGSGWSPEYGASWTPPLYPRMHLLPNGKVFYSGSTTGSRYFDPSTNTWSGVVATTNFSGTRTYGTSVLLPLLPSNGYVPRVMIFGGGNPATSTSEIIDLSAPTPKWTFGPPMSQPRIEMNATILPSGKVLAVGGSTNDEDTNTASLNADLYDPVTNTFSSAGVNAFARLYHSNSLLLPDATVLFVGGNPARGTYETHTEIYTPAYLFNSDGTPATRPTISSVSQGVLGYGAGFQVQTPNASSISSVALIRAGAPTHAFDMDQRFVGLNFSLANGTTLNVTTPPNGNIAPPGYYLLFLLNSAGVPSVAQFVQLSTNPVNQPPIATINNPATNQTILTGQSVFFSGSGSDPDGTIAGYSWTLPGGTPNSSVLATPGNVTYSTPGSYIASLTVTDNSGLSDPSPSTRTIVVENPPTISSLTLNPSSVTGGSSSTATITLSAPAPTAGITVSLSSSKTSVATVPANTNIAAGSTTTTFPVNTTSVVSTATSIITANYLSSSATATLTANPAGTGASPPSIDAQVNAKQSSPGPTVKTATFSTNSGNELLLAFVATDYVSGSNTTVTSVAGGGLTWALVVRTNTQSGSSEIWRAFATGPISNATVTATLSQSVIASIEVISFTGVDTSGINGSGAVGATKSVSSGSGAPAATLVTTRNNSWVFGVANDYDNAIARTLGPGQTLIDQYLTPSGDTYWMQRQTSATPLSGTSVTLNDTAPTGDRYNFSLVEVLPPAVVVPTYSVSGSVTPVLNGTGTKLTLSGAASTSVNADSSGNYTLTNLPNGSYTVTPSKTGFTFTPPNQQVTVGNANFTGVNFTIQPLPTYSISGTITPTALGSNVALTLSGAATSSTTANGSGNYSFTGLLNGSYTVTPNKNGESFTPTTLPVTINNANAPNSNFTAQTVTASSVAIDATASGDQNTAKTTVASPVFSTNSTNELLLAFVSSDDPGTGTNITVNSIAGAGLTWVLVGRSNTESGTAEIWRAFSTTLLTNVSVTATLSKSVTSSIVVMSYSGVSTSGTNGSGAIGAFKRTSANPGAPSASLVTTKNNSLVVGVGNDYDNAIARTLGPGQTLVHQSLSPVGDTYWVQRQSSVTLLSGTTITINDTQPTGDRYNLAICEILAAP
jgi:hypothetical protein